MIQRVALAAAVAASAAAAGCDAGQPFGNMAGQPDRSAGRTPLKAHSVVDQTGFERPLEAAQIMVPQGWRVESGVRWDGNGQCTLDIASPTARITSPDGREVIDILPGFLVSTWADPILGRGSRPGDYCVVASAETGEKLLRSIAAPMLRPGAVLQEVRQQPVPAELAQVVEQMQVMPGGRFDAYAVEGIFRSADGAAQEKLILRGTILALPQVVDGVAPMILNQNSFNLGLRAAPERMAGLETLANVIVANIRYSPEWSRRVGEMKREISRTIDRGIEERGRIISRRGRGSGPSQRDWQEGQDREEERNRRFIETVIREEQRCFNPETGEVVVISSHDQC
jgi:hypothetical protein